MRIMLAATSLDPHYGGPAFSVSSLASALAKAGGEVGLWSADGQVSTSPLLPVQNGLTRLSGSPTSAMAAFAPDVVHDNGLWLPHNHILAIAAARDGVPRVVSPRGMLDPWARGHKRWKKLIAWTAYQRHDLRQAQLLHATSQAEADHLDALGLGPPISVIPNGVDLPRLPSPARKSSALRRALFLGRIYPVKGLPMLIEAWARIRPRDWCLEIAGPDESGHRAEISRLVQKADLENQVTFLGPLESTAKSAALYSANVLILPSHSESFGMVVAEALAHSVPVLTTTAVPWPGLEAQGCGWRVPPTTEGLVDGLSRVFALDSETLRRTGAKGRTFVTAEYGWREVALRFLATYQSLVQRPRRPRPRRASPSGDARPRLSSTGAVSR